MNTSKSHPSPSGIESPSSARLVRTVVESPVGELTVVASDAGLRAVLWPADDPERIDVAEAAEEPEHPVLRLVAVQLEEYFAGERQEFDVPLDVVGTDFQRAAWDVLLTIPYGTTATYAEQAERLGDRNKARAVGAANGRNPVSIIVPCHRVVGASGGLTGFAGGLQVKSWLLDHEQRHTGARLPL